MRCLVTEAVVLHIPARLIHTPWSFRVKCSYNIGELFLPMRCLVTEAVVLHIPARLIHTPCKILSHFPVTLRPHSPGYQDCVQTLHKVPLIGETDSKVLQVLPCCDDLS